MLFMYIAYIQREKKTKIVEAIFRKDEKKNWSLTQLSGMCCIEKAIKISTKINQLANKEVVLKLVIWLHSSKKEISETNMKWGWERLHFIYFLVDDVVFLQGFRLLIVYFY